MKKSKKQLDDETISEGKHNRRGGVIYITPEGDIDCANPRIRWLAETCAKGGMKYNSKLGIWEISKEHRLPDRCYVSLWDKLRGKK